MKTIYSIPMLVLFILFADLSIAQNMVINPGFESWTSDTKPEGYNSTENISKESTIVRSGNFSAKHTSASSTKKVNQVIQGIEPGVEYTIQFYFFDNDDAAKMRIWSYWLDGTSTLPDDEEILRPNTYSTNSDQWQLFSAVITAPAQATAFRFELRVYHQDGNNGGAVYYDDLLFTGDMTIKPEPTNYPTNFVAEVKGIGVRMEWEEATGEQLPDAYLIYGVQDQSANISETPEDGVPIANNTDISLGYIAWNVPYGIESHQFNKLDSHLSLLFHIYPYTNSGESIDYKTDGTPPSARITTNAYSLLMQETFDESLGLMSQYNVLGEQVWEHYNFNNEDFARMTGFSAGAHANEDWLISPAIEWSSLVDTLLLNFRSARNYDGDPLALLVSQDYNGASDPNLYTWTDITHKANWSLGSFAWAASGEVELIVNAAPPLYFAFKYTSNDIEASTWQVDDVSVYGIYKVGLQENQPTTAIVYPNPSDGHIQIELKQSALISIYEKTGRQITAISCEMGMQQLDLKHLFKGLYIIQIHYTDGKTALSKFVIQ
ncbi:MAG: choice-of-anchor J domain-containing protein [Bacteroidales bacterium]|nr:choice-of-anchor J domain-containing protein [Bacteroidales bacterium]